MPKTKINKIPEAALDWVKEGKSAALATVLETWGSAPRQAGSQMAIGEGGKMIGSVSGGCVEGAVVAEAQEALDDGKPRILEYGVADDDAFAVGLACGGRIRILVEPVGRGDGPSEGLLTGLVKARKKRRAVVLAVNTKSWERRLIKDETDPLWDAAQEAMRLDKSQFEGDWFLGVHNPPLRLIVVGAVHIAQALTPMAQLAGFDVTIIDPREAFATSERFPKTKLLVEWPDEAFDEIKLDARTAVVTLTHDAKLDDPGLQAALRSKAFYVGALGSKRTHEKRCARLEAAGVSRDALERIHAPVGLNIGAASPPEIAVSILAQILKRLRRVGSKA